MPVNLLKNSALALVFSLSLAACATAPEDPVQRAEYEALNDPLEPLNRQVFNFNQFIDKLLLRPMAEIYSLVLPEDVRASIAGILTNMGEPVRFANNLMQGDVTRASTTLGRFVVNTTAGVGGSFDIAGDYLDMPVQNADFGQTLYVWGVEDAGPYLVLPLLGPSNPRDAVGFGVDSMLDPWGYVIQAADGRGGANRYTASSLSATMLDKRSGALEALDDLEKNSIDFYAQMRSITRQYRAKQLRPEGAVEDMPAFEEIPDEAGPQS
jgi:phospholipid-binding lipoprotein MlaA